MSSYLKTKNGVECIASENSLQNEPIKVTTYWPVIGISNPYGSPLPPEGSEMRSMGMGTGSFLSIRGSIKYHIKNEACAQEEEPIPPPRTRCQTRYKDGRWEILHRSRGWLPA